MRITEICICGGGSLGTVTTAVLASKGIRVNILTGHPDQWNKDIEVTDPKQFTYHGTISKISSLPEKVIPSASMVLLCLPGNKISDTLKAIKPYLSPTCMVGSIFSSTGFFFEAKKILPSSPLWGFQRVPYIARVHQYGVSAHLLGYKKSLAIAIENLSDDKKEEFRVWIESYFDTPTTLLNNYLEASISNSNPLLHTARLYTMFNSWDVGKTYPYNPLFYHEWNDAASSWLIKMDKELFGIIDRLPVSKGFLKPILEYYESCDASSLTHKIRSITSFADIQSPMYEDNGVWKPNFKSRYFIEDFQYGLKYIKSLAKEYDVPTPCIDLTIEWWNKIQASIKLE